MKERFSKLLLGEDMSGHGKGVSSALTLSNAITNLAASVFGEIKRLEPMPTERKAMWKREVDWLLSVTDHIVEMVPEKKSIDGNLMEKTETWVGPDGRLYHSHDGLAPHTHEHIYSPGYFSRRAQPLLTRNFQERAFTVGIGAPVGTGKTALMLALCKCLRNKYSLAAVSNDIFTKEDGEFLVKHGALPEDRIRAVETGGCPHVAIRGKLTYFFVNLGEDRDRKLRIFTGDEHPFHDRPLEPYVMPPRQVREMRLRDSVYNLCNLGHKVKTNVAFDSVLGHSIP